MKNTKYAILIVIAHVMWKHKSVWCYAAQAKMLELLSKYHKVEISRRQLNYHLRDLRDQGLIKSWKRHHRNEKGQIILLSSATCLTIKGCVYLVRKGVTKAVRHLKVLKERYGIPVGSGKKSYGQNHGQNHGQNRAPEGLLSYADFSKMRGLDPVPS